MRRPFLLLVAVISAAALLSACGGREGPAAARVDSTEISRSQLDDELEALSTNTTWMNAVAPELNTERVVYPNGGVSTQFTAAWLTTLIRQVVVDRMFERRNLTVTAENRRDANEAARAFFATAEDQTFDSLPKWFRDAYVERQSRYEAVRASLPEQALATDAELEDVLERARTLYCTAGNPVSYILAETREQADAIAASLAQGADFATSARESADENSSGTGGFLTCTGSANYAQLPEAFRQIADQLAPGSVSAPFQSEVGWNIVKVGSWDLANVRPLAESLFAQQRVEPIIEESNLALLDSKIWVDPRYGTVTPSPVRIQAPSPPEPVSKPGQ